MEPAKQASPSEGAEQQPAFGSEAWLKLAAVFLALLYIAGHGVITGFTSRLGLAPADFGMTEKDYVAHGLMSLLPDFRYYEKEPLAYVAAIPIVSWALFILVIPLLFYRKKMLGKRRRPDWVGTMTRSALLIPAGLLVSLLSVRHGGERAGRVLEQAPRLPLAILAYTSPDPDKKPSYLYGRLLFRNEKIVCMAEVDAHILSDVPQNEGLENRLFLVPSERVIFLSTLLPRKTAGKTVTPRSK